MQDQLDIVKDIISSFLKYSKVGKKNLVECDLYHEVYKKTIFSTLFVYFLITDSKPTSPPAGGCTTVTKSLRLLAILKVSGWPVTITSIEGFSLSRVLKNRVEAYW
jgi:hypothetical protein